MLTFPATLFAYPLRLSYVTNVSSASDLTTYTFAGTSIGTAAEDRFVIVSASLRSTASRTFSSVSIGGTNGTELVKFDSNQTCVGIWGLRVTSGTTADIVVTMSAAASRCACGVWAVYGLNSLTPIDTASSTASPLALSLDTLPGCAVLAATYTGGSTLETWAGLTEDFDTTVEGAHNHGASGLMTTAETPRTVTLTMTGPAGQGGVAVSLI